MAFVHNGNVFQKLAFFCTKIQHENLISTNSVLYRLLLLLNTPWLFVRPPDK